MPFSIRPTRRFPVCCPVPYLAAILFQILVLIYNAPNVVAESGRIDRIDGYGGYKFGMTLKEADAVRADDVVNKDCEFNGIEACIERKTHLFGEEAIITAQVSSETHTLEHIIISFKRLELVAPGACKNVISSISGPLLETFGRKFKEKGRDITWHLPRGGTIELTNLCLNEDKGVDVISYKPSDAFR
jgi:hypothetical protein